jgi:hypothetical protein
MGHNWIILVQAPPWIITVYPSFCCSKRLYGGGCVASEASRQAYA